MQVEDPENMVSANTFKSEDFQTRRTTRNTDIIGDMSRPEIAKRKTHYFNEHGEEVYPPWSPFAGYPYDKDELLIMKEQANKPPEAGTAEAAGRDHYATWNGMAYHQAMAEDLDKVLERLQYQVRRCREDPNYANATIDEFNDESRGDHLYTPRSQIRSFIQVFKRHQDKMDQIAKEIARYEAVEQQQQQQQQ